MFEKSARFFGFYFIGCMFVALTGVYGFLPQPLLTFIVWSGGIALSAPAVIYVVEQVWEKRHTYNEDS